MPRKTKVGGHSQHGPNHSQDQTNSLPSVNFSLVNQPSVCWTWPYTPKHYGTRPTKTAFYEMQLGNRTRKWHEKSAARVVVPGETAQEGHLADHGWKQAESSATVRQVPIQHCYVCFAELPIFDSLGPIGMVVLDWTAHEVVELHLQAWKQFPAHKGEGLLVWAGPMPHSTL